MFRSPASRALPGSGPSPVAIALLLLLLPALLVENSSAADHLLEPSSSNSRLLQASSTPLEPTLTHSPVVDIKWLDTNDYRLLAWTRALGSEVGGLWYSEDGARTWTERTPALSMCPPEFPYLCSEKQVCYQDIESAKSCIGPPNTWCGLPGLTVPDHITDKGWGKWCSNGCPSNYPCLCQSLMVCYKNQEDAQRSPCSGPPGSWCGLPDTTVKSQIPKYGSYCGNNATKGSRDPVEVLAVFSDKLDPAKVVVFGVGSNIWTSTDYGQTFNGSQTSIAMPRWRGSGIKAWKVHPWKDEWLLLLVRRPGCNNQDHALTDCPYDLMLTKDLFNKERTWVNMTAESNRQIAGFVDFDWGASLCPGGQDQCSPDMGINENTVLATMYRKDGDYDQPWDKDVHFVVSNSNFQDYRMRGYCGNMFEVIGRSVYLAYANDCPTDIQGNGRSGDKTFKGIVLFTSQDGGNSFAQACLPVALKQEGYELMSTHDGTGAVVIAEFLIGNGYMDIPASSVYTAGPHHALFSLSLTDAYRADYGFQTDFARIEGLPGVYIANQMVSRVDDVDYSYGMDAGTLVESRITFNGGGVWSAIRAPAAYNFRKCNRCVDGLTHCFLHLRGMSTYDSMTTALPAVYSNTAAPGFIMATGVTATSGMGLLDDPEGLCTWLSTDGGVSWRDVAEGAYIYEFADWGAAIFMARSGANVPTDEVRYSLDFGYSWTTVPLKSALLVDNIRIDPKGQRAWVVVHGRACEADGSADPVRAKCTISSTERAMGTPGLMYTLDMKVLSPDLRRCNADDYESFSVPRSRDDSSPACTLGKVMRIKRRVPSRVCFSGADFVRGLPVNATCNCSALDVECDYGFIRYNDKCTPIVKERLPTCPVVSSGLYTVSESGKRLVHADVCTGVEAVIKDTDGMGGRTGDWDPEDGHRRRGLSGVAKFFITLLVLVVVGGAGAAWWVFAATERQRDAVRGGVVGAASTAAALATSGYQYVRNRIRGRPTDLHEQDMGYFQPLNEMESSHQPTGIFTLK